MKPVKILRVGPFVADFGRQRAVTTASIYREGRKLPITIRREELKDLIAALAPDLEWVNGTIKLIGD